MVIKVVDQLADDAVDVAWELYHEAFKDLNAYAVQRHLMFRHEFVEVMLDPRVRKYLSLGDDGSIAGLSTYTNQLEAMPLISPAYFERRWPELYAARQVWYCGFVAVRESRRSNYAFAELVEAMYRTGTEHGGIIALDFCRYNDEVRHMSRAVRLMLHRLSGNCRAERMDQQEFWLYQFPGSSGAEGLSSAA